MSQIRLHFNDYGAIIARKTYSDGSGSHLYVPRKDEHMIINGDEFVVAAVVTEFAKDGSMDINLRLVRW